jgi:hypothetical protein
MDKAEFTRIFLQNVHHAIDAAQKVKYARLSYDFEIELHGGGIGGDLISVDRAVDIMYLGPTTFYRIIDISVKRVDERNRPTMFVRISSHRPSTFDRTWNNPPGNGPFKILEPMP